MSGPRPKLVLDGTEGIEGRALMLISALHRRALRFAGAELAMTTADPPVLAGLALLRWEKGLDIQVEADPVAALKDASLFAAVAFRDTTHLPLGALRATGVPALIAIQFPDLSRHAPAALVLQRAAHDPDTLGDVIADALWSR